MVLYWSSVGEKDKGGNVGGTSLPFPLAGNEVTGRALRSDNDGVAEDGEEPAGRRRDSEQSSTCGDESSHRDWEW